MFCPTRKNCASSARLPPRDSDSGPLEVQIIRDLKTIHHRHHLTYVCGLASLIYLFGETSIHAGDMRSLLARKGSSPLALSIFSHWEKMVAKGIDQGELVRMEPKKAATCLLEGPLKLLRMHAEHRLRGPLFNAIRESWDLAWQRMECLFIYHESE